MEEKILTNKKHGMLVLVLDILLLLAAIPVMIFGGIKGEAGSVFGWILFAIGLLILCIGWLPLCGLRILKPQEALVVTLFGKYVGTLKGDGFYFVNPFCSAVNPAARTKHFICKSSLCQTNTIGTVANMSRIFAFQGRKCLQVSASDTIAHRLSVIWIN